MLPDNVISSALVYAPFIQAQVAKHSVPLVDYELGGLALNDPSQGLSVQLWTLRKVGNDLVVFDAANVGTVVITVPDAIRISLAFDQNMKPMIAYSTPTSSYLYWFDTFLNANTTTEFPGTSFLRLGLDERRQVLINNSDVILAYHVGNSLRYRQQRDRFQTERTLVADMGTTRLTAVAMNTAYRLQFKLKGDYVQPVYVPPPSFAYWRINVTATSTGDGFFCTVAELGLREVAAGASATIGGTGFSSTNFAGNEAAKAFDASNATFWATAGADNPAHLGYQFATPKSVAQIAITAADNSARAARAPKDFQIQYSADGLAYTTVKTVTNQTGWATGETRLFNIP